MRFFRFAYHIHDVVNCIHIHNTHIYKRYDKKKTVIRLGLRAIKTHSRIKYLPKKAEKKTAHIINIILKDNKNNAQNKNR